MQQDRMVGWCTLFLAIVGKEAPVYALENDLEERERNHFWKTKKWAYANLNRLFMRYVPDSGNDQQPWLVMLTILKIRQPNQQPEECIP